VTAEHAFDTPNYQATSARLQAEPADYSGYKDCGHPEYRNTGDGPQLNDCGCDDQDGE
jgi:hypothetical protein